MVFHPEEDSLALTRTNETSSVPSRDMESETRSVVMDFMGLMPLSCPPTSAFLNPFESSQGESTFDNVSFVNNNAKGRSSLPIYRGSAKVSSDRLSLKTPMYVMRNNGLRTIIRKHNKLIILEDERAGYHGIDLPLPREATDEAVRKPKGRAESVRWQASTDLDILRRPLSRPSDTSNCIQKTPLRVNISTLRDDQGPEKFVSDSSDGIGGTSVDDSPVADVRRGSLFLDSRENLYVDISKIASLERMVDKGELSPAAVPLQNELNGLRLHGIESIAGEVMTSNEIPMSPSTQVADTLRAIADQVQDQFAHELNGAIGKLVGFEESKRLTFEVLKEVALELTKDIAPGWSRVVLPLLLSQTAAVTLLLLGNRSVVGRLVSFTARFLCDDMDDFLAATGGWDGVLSAGIRETPMPLDDIRQDDTTEE